MVITKLVIIRHGESQWNQANIFTGWTDIDLSEKGRAEAQQAGKILKSQGYTFDLAYTSVLKRAIKTLWIIMNELDQVWLPMEKSWHLNERHYGALQGLNKKNIAQQYGEEQVNQWRRSFTATPPAITTDDPRFPGHDVRYCNLTADQLPTSENLALTVQRVDPYWRKIILPQIKCGKRVIIAAHGNSIRAIVKIIDNISQDELMELNIPTARPLIYEFNENMHPINHYFLDQITNLTR